MAALRVPTKLTSGALDPLLVDVARSTDPLQIPGRISTTDPLAIPLAVQSVLTWSRFNNGGVVRSAFDFADELHSARSLQRNVVLLTAVLMASEVRTLIGDDITGQAQRIARDALTESTTIPLRASGQSVGADRSVLAADHVAGLEYPAGLYRRVESRATREVSHEIDGHARELYARSHVDAARRVDWPLGWRVLDMGMVSRTSQTDALALFRNEAYELGQVLFELMQNTHDHARTDDAGYVLRRSVRGIHVRAQTQTRSEIVDGAIAHRDLAEYFSQLPATPGATERGDEDRLRALTVSVIDSGPGLAASILWGQGFRYNFTKDDELRAMLDALRRSDATSQPGLRGMGLTRVQRYLTEVGGYAMVRAGRYRLSRDFRRFPFEEANDDQHRWYGGLREPSLHTRVAGTVFTVIVPTYGANS